MADPPKHVPSVSCLGEFSLSISGPERITVRPKVSELFVLMLLNHDNHIARTHLAHMLWPDSNEKAALENLRSHLRYLRAALGSHAWRIVATDGELGLDMKNVEVDLFRFQHSLRSATQRADISGIEAALNAYGGELLPRSLTDSIEIERTKLRDMFVNGSEALAERLLLAKQRDRALQILWRALKFYPLCESVVGLMLRLSENNVPEAERIFKAHQDAVRKKLGHPVRARLAAQFRRISSATPDADDDNSSTSDPHPPDRIDKAPVPQHTLIGRDVELERIKNSLSMTSLVTLTGPSGVGKTRLALEVGLNCSHNYRNGVVFVDLSQLPAP